MAKRIHGRSLEPQIQKSLSSMDVSPVYVFTSCEKYLDLPCGFGADACWVKRNYPGIEVHAADRFGYDSEPSMEPEPFFLESIGKLIGDDQKKLQLLYDTLRDECHLRCVDATDLPYDHQYFNVIQFADTTLLAGRGKDIRAHKIAEGLFRVMKPYGFLIIRCGSDLGTYDDKGKVLSYENFVDRLLNRKARKASTGEILTEENANTLVRGYHRRCALDDIPLPSMESLRDILGGAGFQMGDTNPNWYRFAETPVLVDRNGGKLTSSLNVFVRKPGD